MVVVVLVVACRCLSVEDQEQYACRARQTRRLVAQRCLGSVGAVGVWAWAWLVVLSVLCLLGWWGNYANVFRCASHPSCASARFAFDTIVPKLCARSPHLLGPSPAPPRPRRLRPAPAGPCCSGTCSYPR